MNPEIVSKKIINGIRAYFKKHCFKKAIIGMSGGLDSSVVAVLAAKAIGKGNLTGAIMPELGVTKEQSITDAIQVCKKLGIKYELHAINPILELLNKEVRWKQSNLARANTKARIRMIILYNFANTHNALVMGTGNKSEISLGYFTKYGDSGVDILPIGGLYKTEVKELAEYLKLPMQIIDKVPSAELFEGQTDEQELGASYEKIDEILKNIRKGKKVSGKLAEKIKKRMKATEHKRCLPPII